MASRREFLATLSAGTAGVTLLQGCAPKGGGIGTLPANLLYTSASQGQWDGKGGSHLPNVNIDKGSGTVSMETKHGMSAAHYIVRHSLVAPDGSVLHAHTFAPTDEKAASQAELKEKLQGLTMAYAMSYCNLHDLWVAEVRI
jgi:superoxide reductase